MATCSCLVTKIQDKMTICSCVRPEMLVNNYKSKQHNIPKIVTNHSKSGKVKKFGNNTTKPKLH